MVSHSGIRGISSLDDIPDVLYELLFPASVKNSAEQRAEPVGLDGAGFFLV